MATLLAGGIVIVLAGSPDLTIPFTVFAACLFIAVVGFADDVRSLPVVPRLLLQAAAVAAVVLSVPGDLQARSGLSALARTRPAGDRRPVVREPRQLHGRARPDDGGRGGPDHGGGRPARQLRPYAARRPRWSRPPCAARCSASRRSTGRWPKYSSAMSAACRSACCSAGACSSSRLRQQFAAALLLPLYLSGRCHGHAVPPHGAARAVLGRAPLALLSARRRTTASRCGASSARCSRSTSCWRCSHSPRSSLNSLAADVACCWPVRSPSPGSCAGSRGRADRRRIIRPAASARLSPSSRLIGCCHPVLAILDRSSSSEVNRLS